MRIAIIPHIGDRDNHLAEIHEIGCPGSIRRTAAEIGLAAIQPMEVVMPRKGIGEIDVRNALKMLKAEGRAPTVRLIREVLGTGSTAKISQLLTIIQSAPEPVTELGDTMPPDLSKRHLEFGEEIWRRAVELASADNRRLRETLEKLETSLLETMEQVEFISKQLKANHELLHSLRTKAGISSERKETAALQVFE